MRAALVLLGLFAASACTDASLYSPASPRKEADRLALTGRVCTEDPVEARFPVRVIMLVDQATGLLYSDFDPASQRVDTLRELVQIGVGNPELEFAIIGYAGRPRKLAPTDGDFTRNPGELFNAVTSLALPENCISADLCRDWAEAIRTARTLVEGDVALSPAGRRVLTQYIVLHIAAGPPVPLADGAACCAPDDVQCQDANMGPSWGCERQLNAEAVASMRDLVLAAGAAGLRYHTIQLAAPNAPMGENDEIQTTLEEMSFAGGGTFQRFENIAGLSVPAVNVLNLRTVLASKLLIAANVNAIPGPDGPQVDSDADGLTDLEEEGAGTSPTLRDTDGDGVSDHVEILSGLDPLLAEVPRVCEGINPFADRDLDGLTDCDELLLGTEPTLVDSDGDALPDRLEVVSSIDYVAPDAEADTDGDGVNNGDEIAQHSDPRSTDVRLHLPFGYRYEIEDEGFTTEMFAQDPTNITGVSFGEVSGGTTPGLGTLYYNAQEQTLAWQDANDPSAGPRVPVGAGGTFELWSSSFADIQGDAGKRVFVNVAPAELSPRDFTERIRVIFRDRQCLSYTIRNIRLVETQGLDDGTPAGTNDVRLFFAEMPEGRYRAPGPFRMAQIPVEFRPPEERDPPEAILEVFDSEYVRPVLGTDP